MTSEESNAWRDDRMLPRGAVLYTLSYQLTRTQDVEMFYAVYDYEDLDQYLTMFNGPLMRPLIDLDDSSEDLTAEPDYKYIIKSLTTRDIHVAGEASAATVFAQLVRTHEDFCDFVLSKARLQSYFPPQKYFFKGYRVSQNALKRLRVAHATNQELAADDLYKTFRFFNYAIPSYGGLSAERAHDIAVQRRLFFDAMRTQGFGAMVDTNDALYGGFHARTPLVVFDLTSITLMEVEQTTGDEKKASAFISAAQRMFGKR